MMQRIIFLSFCFFMTVTALKAQQNIFSTKNGTITFLSKAPLEVITAASTQLEGVIDVNSLSYAFTISIRSFEGFNNGLQKQHFYENYMEVAKYPAATFIGKIIEQVDLMKPGTYEVRAKGQLTIHGKAQERIIKTHLVTTGTEIRATSQFLVPLVDHQIEVPKIVNQKIAEEIEVTVKATLSRSGKT